VDRRIAEAVQKVREWGWTGEWRVGEERIGDALAAVVCGSGGIENLPWDSTTGMTSSIILV
jgi:hypothetical protein